MQTKKKLVAILSIASLLMSGTLINPAKAASLSNASDTLSTSNLNTSATHTVKFNTNQALSVGDYFQVVLPADFGDVLQANISCPAGTNPTAQNTETARCTATAGIATGTITISISGVTNPSYAGSQTIIAGSYASGGSAKETANLMVAIIDSVVMNASVPSTLNFVVAPVASGTSINGIVTTNESATTSVNFGTLAVGNSAVMGQELKVTTNATYGYSVTVQQNQALTNAAGATIDSFDNGVVPGAPIAWNNPTGTLGSTATYGHMGFTTDDADLSVRDFTSSKWFGFSGTSPVEVMYNNGPADGSTQSKGLAKVAYRLHITALQEAGDYTNTLTYIATPSY